MSMDEWDNQKEHDALCPKITEAINSYIETKEGLNNIPYTFLPEVLGCTVSRCIRAIESPRIRREVLEEFIARLIFTSDIEPEPDQKVN